MGKQNKKRKKTTQKGKKVNWPRIFQYVCTVFNYMPTKWWFCFGTMLTLIRDEGKFKKIDDVDVGVFYDDFEPRYITNWCKSNGFVITKHIVDDITRKPLYYSIEPMEDIQKITGKFALDVFMWIKYKGFYWHTYDVKMEKPSNGIPRKYIFKGVPENAFSDIIHIDSIAGTSFHGYVPLKYGTLLDLWYPNWIVKREECSHAKWVMSMDSCKEIHKGTATFDEQNPDNNSVFAGRI